VAQQPTLTRLQGLAPNRTAFEGQAFRAENVDLSGGGIKPVKAPSYVEPGHSGEIVYHNGSWVSGEENYISTDIQGIPALIFKSTEGTWQMNMANLTSADLWLTPPQNLLAESAILPTPPASEVVEDGTGGIEAGDYQYFVRLVEKDANGNILRESGFSNAFTITIADGRTQITRPAVSNLPDRVSWKVYRRKVGATFANLVGEASMTIAFIFDDVSDNSAGETIYPEPTDATVRDYRYVAVWVRNFGGWEHESAPSDIVAIHQSSDGVKLTLTDTPPIGVTSWRIYRISLGLDPTTTFQMVADLPTTTTEYLDKKENVELGDAMQSSYRADNGALVTAGVPASQFTGMAGPFNGFFVGWIGRDLYLSQPGNPTWWPGAFVVEANFDIVGVSQVGGNIAVITTGGVQFGYGVEPEAFALSQSVFGPGGSEANGISKEIYLGYSGIYAITNDGGHRQDHSVSHDGCHDV